MTSTGKILTRSKATVGLDEIIEGMKAFDTDTLEQFMHQVGNLVARKKTPNHLSERESDLPMAINNSIPAELQQRFEALSAKSQSGRLFPDEHAEMIHLIDVLEQKHAERLEKLLDLAQLRAPATSTACLTPDQPKICSPFPTFAPCFPSSKNYPCCCSLCAPCWPATDTSNTHQKWRILPFPSSRTTTTRSLTTKPSHVTRKWRRLIQSLSN